MSESLLVVSAVGCVLSLGLAFSALQGWLAVRRLADVTAPEPQPFPSVSLIVPARNEERDVEAGVRSLLRQDAPNLRVLAIDDRSTDATGSILDRLSETEDRIEVVHITDLPSGWLGKNHAMQWGAEASESDWLLFTDADIVMVPETVRKAIAYAETRKLDHLAIAPETDVPGWGLRSFVLYPASLAWAMFRFWRCRNPRSSASIGIGAFNLVRRSSFEAIEGMRPIALRPDDDLQLGKRLKESGARQELLGGVGTIRVPWYASLGEAVRGLEKNSFAVVGYRLWPVIGFTLVILALDVLPYGLIFVTEGPARGCVFAWIAFAVLRQFATASVVGIPRLAACGHLFGAVTTIFVQWRSAVLCLLRDGIRWRDTHYPLSELRANEPGTFTAEHVHRK